MPEAYWPPAGYTVRVDEQAGVPFYRAIRIAAPCWESPLLRATYEAASADAEDHRADAICEEAGL